MFLREHIIIKIYYALIPQSDTSHRAQIVRDFLGSFYTIILMTYSILFDICAPTKLVWTKRIKMRHA